MSTINTKPTTTKRPAGYTKAVWEQDTFRVYNGLVKLVKGEISLSQFTNHPTVKSLCEGCGITKGLDDKTAVKTRSALTVSLIISMAHDRTSAGEKERHIAPIYRLRAFFNGEWKTKSELKVTYTEPKAPTKANNSSPKGKKAAAPKFTNEAVAAWIKNLPVDQKSVFLKEIAA